MEYIYRIIQNPPKVIDNCNEINHKFSSNDKVFQALRYMKKNDFSQVPITENGRIRGILTMETIARWIDDSIQRNLELTDNEIHKVNSFKENKVDYKLVASDTTVYEVLQIFEKSITEGSPLKAILVSKYGTDTDRLLGIVTPFDIIKLTQM